MNENKKNEVILIGLPNSGKSTLINSLTNTKSSIVGSEPNTTRDKISTYLELNNKQIILSDLPGFDDNPDDFNKAFQNKLQQFLKDADRILFVIDINSKNFSGLDKINNLLQLVKVETKTTTVFNKCENFNHYDLDKRMFKYIYGKETFISGYHKIGTDELLDNLIKFSGKEEEVLFDDKLFNVIDTAGVPRKKQKDQIDRYASKLSLSTLDSSLVSFIVIDSSEGINFEDLRLINESVENYCTPILIFNKWDLLNEEDKDRINSNIKIQLKKFTWLKIIRISALTKKGLNKFSATLDEINSQLQNRIDTSDLNLYFRELWVANPTQPPSFSFNLSSRIPKNYISFIENKLRSDHNFNNVALKIKVKI